MSTYDFDVIIVGAGISGINAGYRLQTNCPTRSYAILEARGDLGGTWDFFKYPGFRSDSDLHTFGFQWRPWTANKTIADGASIKSYLKETAEMFGIDKKMRFNHKLKAADWSSKEQQWTLSVDVLGEPHEFTARFIILSTGYYDYDQAMQAPIPGIENFKGRVVHPQFWPEDLDYAGKKVVIIGSGATAVTLLPAIAKTAASVTMLQRSPGYVMAMPSVDRLGNILHRILPTWLAYQLIRLKYLTIPFLFYKFCRAFPRAAKKAMIGLTRKELPPSLQWDPHFNPTYYPWEQRLCVCPDGDFFQALRDGRASVVTGHITAVREHDIVVDTQPAAAPPPPLDADIIVTATGLKILLAGGAALSVDGRRVDPASKFLWNGQMMADVPNMAFVIGYTNASWTLGADATARMTTRLLNAMDRSGAGVAVPRVADADRAAMKARPLLDLKSTYLVNAQRDMPMTGDRKPWLPRNSLWSDIWNVRFADVTYGLEFLD